MIEAAIAKEVAKEVAEVAKTAVSEVGKLPDKIGNLSELKNLPDKISCLEEVVQSKSDVSFAPDKCVSQFGEQKDIFTKTDCNEQMQKNFNVESKTDIEKQEIADNAAREYNEKYYPYERAIRKGVDGVTMTPNGGVSFEQSDAIYTDAAGNKGIVSIEATGNRTADFDKANEKMGLSETPDGYVWHHMDNYDVKSNTITMQLVKDDAHNAAKPHAGGCAQYDAVHGPSYNPARKDT